MVVAVAWAKKIKFAALKDVERYEANVDFIGEPTNRDRKKGGCRDDDIPWKEDGASHDEVYPSDTSID